MLQDQSQDFQDTWVFLDNRLQNVLTVGKCVGQVQNTVSTAGSELWAYSQIVSFVDCFLEFWNMVWVSWWVNFENLLSINEYDEPTVQKISVLVKNEDL